MVVSIDRHAEHMLYIPAQVPKLKEPVAISDFEALDIRVG